MLLQKDAGYSTVAISTQWFHWALDVLQDADPTAQNKVMYDYCLFC